MRQNVGAGGQYRKTDFRRMLGYVHQRQRLQHGGGLRTVTEMIGIGIAVAVKEMCIPGRLVATEIVGELVFLAHGEKWRKAVL